MARPLAAGRSPPAGPLRLSAGGSFRMMVPVCRVDRSDGGPPVSAARETSGQSGMSTDPTARSPMKSAAVASASSMKSGEGRARHRLFEAFIIIGRTLPPPRMVRRSRNAISGCMVPIQKSEPPAAVRRRLLFQTQRSTTTGMPAKISGFGPSVPQGCCRDRH